MKNLIEYIEEGLLKGQETTLDSGESTSIEVQRQEVIDFIKDNYYGVNTYDISKKPNKDGLFEIFTHNDITVKNHNITALTNGKFIFTYTGNFSIDLCKKLKSLDGCPEEMAGVFSAYQNYDLESLKGGPRIVGRTYMVYECPKIKSLEGCPEKVGGEFWICKCGKQFTELDVRRRCDVGENISVN